MVLRPLLLCAFLAAIFGNAAGGNNHMPFRPGYGLGAWIPPEVVQSMKRESTARSKISMLEKAQTDSASVVQELKQAVRAREEDLRAKEIKLMRAEKLTRKKQKGAPSTENEDWLSPEQIAGLKQMISRGKAQLEETRSSESDIADYSNGLQTRRLNAYKALWDQQLQEIEMVDQIMADGSDTDKASNLIPSSFSSNVESAVQWNLSPIVYKDRNFDSLTLNTQYFEANSNKQGQRGRSTASRMAESIRHQVGGSLGDNIAATAEARSTYAFQEKKIESTLLLTASSTHRFVKQFETLIIDIDKVREAWNYYYRDEWIPDPTTFRTAFVLAYHEVEEAVKAKAEKREISSVKEPRLSMLTELSLGSAMVGMVHVVQRSNDHVSSESARMTTQSLKQKTAIATALTSLTGDTKFTKEKAAYLNNLASSNNLNIDFDMTSMGYIPTIKSQELKMTIKEFKDFDPAAFSSSQLGGNSGASGESAIAAAGGQVTQQSNMGSVIAATVDAVTKESSHGTKTFSSSTFVDAFDDFAQAAKSSKGGMGVPVGMNVKSFVKADVVRELAEKYLNHDEKKNKPKPRPTAKEASSSEQKPSGTGAPEEKPTSSAKPAVNERDIAGTTERGHQRDQSAIRGAKNADKPFTAGHEIREKHPTPEENASTTREAKLKELEKEIIEDVREEFEKLRNKNKQL